MLHGALQVKLRGGGGGGREEPGFHHPHHGLIQRGHPGIFPPEFSSFPPKIFDMWLMMLAQTSRTVVSF